MGNVRASWLFAQSANSDRTVDERRLGHWHRAGRPIVAAAFDGLIRRSFEIIGRYRTAERMLTRRLRPLIGKPGNPARRLTTYRLFKFLRPALMDAGIAPGCPQCRPRKSLSRPREAKTLISARLGDQAALSKMFFILVLIGAVISVVSFCAIPVRCRVCSASASICLRACSVDNSTNADGVFTPST